MLVFCALPVAMVSVDGSSKNNAVVLVTHPTIVTASLISASLNEVLVQTSGIYIPTALTTFLFRT